MLSGDMRSIRFALRRPWPVALLLAVFLAGTNYCLAAALAGPHSRLACAMQATLAPASASAPVPACHAALPLCPACATKSSHAPASRTGVAQCCITLAPVAKALDATPALDGAPIAVFASAMAAPAPDAPRDFGAAPIFDTGPPSGPEASPASPRAPPLA
jgi:hypothetical protein